MAIEPVTREERFLAAAGGQSVTPPAPITRKEQLLKGIIDAVKSGGATPDVIVGAVNDYLNANPVQPGATTEQAAQIEQNKNDIADLQTEVDELKESGGNGSGQNPPQDGADGFSPIATVTQTAEGATITITDKNGTTTATVKNGKDGADGAKGDKGDTGATGAQGNPGKDGANGKDGVSATHSWNGTTLTITSASGTSSADLKGEKGDKGEQGIQGIQGEPGEKGETGAAGKDGVDGSDYVLTDDDKKEIAALAGVVTVPDYWLEELENKADAIQIAMETAGRNKSAFLWYTDAHWPLSAKKSPALLGYLCEHTPMNRVNFGGDIVGDPNPHSHANTGYVYDWRSQIAGLPHHHSVYGNHDLNHRATDVRNIAYAQLLAQEESAHMVIGGESYYYIDSPAERTRYLYLSYITAGAGFSDNETAEEMVAQGKFITDALASVEEGWHIVAIAHRWWQYTKGSNNQLVIEGGSVPFYEAEILRVFDAYNARATAHEAQNYIVATDFSNAKGKVEFCIGGHCHLDYDFTSPGGIPVIITASEANQERNTGETEDNGVIGTITESAVFGIIADYSDPENTKITVVGVGRGTSRVVRRADIKPVSLSDITYSGDTTVGAALDAAKFSFTVNYSNGTTDTVHGAASVSPATIGVVGDNAVTITYTEAEVTVSGAATIVGTAAPVANLFDKNDPDVLLGGRINSGGNAVYQADGQLVTGWIEGKVGDVFTIKCDKPNTANNYVGATNCFNGSKGFIGNLSTAHTTAVSMSDDGMTVVCTIPATLNGIDFSATVYIRICVAYTDIDSIIITKA